MSAAPAPVPARARVRVPPAAPATLAGVLGVAAVVRYGTGATALLAAYLSAVLILAACTDIAEHRVPNALIVPAIPITLAAQAWLAPDRLVECLVFAGATGFILVLPALVFPQGLGMGDVKLAVLLGAALGVRLLDALTIAWLALLPFAIWLLVRRGLVARRATIPFAPFLALGALVVLFVAAPLGGGPA